MCIRDRSTWDLVLVAILAVSISALNSEIKDDPVHNCGRAIKDAQYSLGKIYLDWVYYWPNMRKVTSAYVRDMANFTIQINKAAKVCTKIDMLSLADKAFENFANSLVEKQIFTQDCVNTLVRPCLLYTSPSPRDRQKSRMPSSA
eukprot:TRINITY_DN7819_c0_g1_i16.p1 TRINITY_DN7819_c0_g1~~TRINITY_DN7819_c0_g1_i16.p1  ORF type:complete len:145 (+),score=34.01 TRINITY_DN7819_c0_g1_i16:66-500(+)